MNPFFALSIDGLLHDRLFVHHMEHGLRNLLDREELRLRQHAQGVLHPRNRTEFAETFEFVHTDFNCNTLFSLFDMYARRLDAARRWVRTLVNLFDIRRRQDVQRDRDEILVHYRHLHRDDDADRSVYDTLMEEVEANHPRLDVRTLYCCAPENAAATCNVRRNTRNGRP